MATALDELLQANLNLPTAQSLANTSLPTPLANQPTGVLPLNPTMIAAPPPQPQPQQPGAQANFFSDPTSLLELGAMLLQPRSGAQGQFGFIADALNKSVQNFRGRTAAEEDRALARTQTQQKISEGKTKEKLAERSLESQDLLDDLTVARTTAEEARAEKLLAEAFNEKKTGGKSKAMPAAEVQAIEYMAGQLKALNPKKYSGTGGNAKARVDAFTLRERSGQNPDLWYADKIAEYLENNASLAKPEEMKRDIGILKALRDSLKQTLVNTIPNETTVTDNKKKEPDKKEVEKPPEKVDAADVVIQTGVFKGLPVKKAQESLRLWKGDKVKFEKDLTAKYPDPVVREQVRKSLQLIMDRM